jgi:hypothetical protein
MLIPGMGNRMVREFFEYRPYTAIAQFRKEIVSTSTTKRLPGWNNTCSCPSIRTLRLTRPF